MTDKIGNVLATSAIAFGILCVMVLITTVVIVVIARSGAYAKNSGASAKNNGSCSGARIGSGGRGDGGSSGGG